MQQASMEVQLFGHTDDTLLLHYNAICTYEDHISFMYDHIMHYNSSSELLKQCVPSTSSNREK